MKTRKVEPKKKVVKTDTAPELVNQIGVRELRDSLSEQLHAVRAGKTLTVTDHGEPVAMIIPFGLPAGILRMLSEGSLTWNGRKDFPKGAPIEHGYEFEPDWYERMKEEDEAELDRAISASAADLRR